MAWQGGVIKFRGLIGSLSFYKTRNGYLVREKGGVDGKRIATDPAFVRTRENASEFGNSSRAAKLLRMAFQSVIKKIRDGKMVNRLTTAMMAVVTSDLVSRRGKRNVPAGEINLLEGFEFNMNAHLKNVFPVSFTAQIDRSAGTLSVSVPEFIAKENIIAPEGATHCRFISAAAEIDFVNGAFLVSGKNSVDITLGDQTVDAFTLNNVLAAGSTLPLLLVFGLEFYQEVNGIMYGLNNVEYNCLRVVKVDG